ncbi:MAG: 2-keto-4-pentenoate hydratase [Acidimicrobiales bacterium]
MTNTDETLQSWAATIVGDNRAGRRFSPPWGDASPPLDDAYRVQDAVLNGLAPDRGPLGGYKVAATAKPLQEMLGLTEPLGGLVHAGQLYTSPHTIDLSDYVSPALEFEVAVRLGRDVPRSAQPFTSETIAPYVGEVITSFEVIDSRGADLGAVGPAALIADRCACMGAVLGDAIDEFTDLDLTACPVEVEWNGEVVDRGITGAAMGHPFAGLAWIANHLAARGRRLDADHIVLTGSAFTPKPVSAGDAVTYRIDGIGEASVAVV